MTDEVRVTQADRKAAKSLLGRDDAGPSWWSIDSGNADNDQMVQAFARHRHTATSDALAAMREAREWHEREDKALSKQPNANVGQNGWMRAQHKEQIANLTTAIEQIEGKQP